VGQVPDLPSARCCSRSLSRRPPRQRPNTQTLQYGSSNQLTAVADSFRRQLSFAYAGGKLQTVTTPDALILTYGYTGAQLTSVGFSTSPLTSQTYLYENAHAAQLDRATIV
jgi:hypothetical protein